MSRDLKADLELCNEATPGPWYREKTGANFKGFSSEVIIADTSRYATGNKVYAEPEGGQFPSSDADFIAQAREGWPYAIEQALAEKERADKYEALVREQENQIDILSTTLAMYCSPYYDMQERAEKAEALARELVHHLDNTACVLASRVKLARKDLIGRTRDGGTQWASDVLGEVKQVVVKAKEVLGDDQNTSLD